MSSQYAPRYLVWVSDSGALEVRRWIRPVPAPGRQWAVIPAAGPETAQSIFLRMKRYAR